MLVLSRRTREWIRIGEHIRICVVRIGPETVRLGIEAPREVNIVREEIVREEPVIDLANKEMSALEAVTAISIEQERQEQ